MKKNINNSGKNCIREDIAKKLPFVLLQSYFTWVTGKPFIGQKPLWKSSKFEHLFSVLLMLLLGVGINSFYIVNCLLNT